jgi:hypothetical protein
MHKPKYTKLASDGSALPEDHPNDGPDKHLAVLVEHPMLAKPITVSAYRCSTESANFAKAGELAAAHDAYGWSWRAGSVEELFFVADRTRSEVGLDLNFFPDAEGYETTWSGDIDASSPRGYAWFVYLGNGSAYWGYQSFQSRVRAVRAGQ